MAESQKDWFDLDCISPYMLLVSKINKEKIISMTNDQKLFGIEKLNIPRSEVPAVTHVDYTAKSRLFIKKLIQNIILYYRNLVNLVIALYWLTPHLMSEESQ